MSLGKLIKSIFAGPVGSALLAWGKTEAEKAVAAIKRSATGAQIVKLVQDAEASGKSGPEKMQAVLLDAMPLLTTLATAGGLMIAQADVETLARAVIESTVADLKSGSLAVAILKALGA